MIRIVLVEEVVSAKSYNNNYNEMSHQKQYI